VLNLTLDNASNNDTMVVALRNVYLATFGGMAGHMRCIAHVLNLSARALMKPFD
ncbi:hypothetical protein BKA62DRAFT_597876, partial [Auriculariales sp. MPI-PUGE-AT-0066]